MNTATTGQLDYRNEANLDAALFYAKKGCPEMQAQSLADAIGFAAIRYATSHEEYWTGGR